MSKQSILRRQVSTWGLRVASRRVDGQRPLSCLTSHPGDLLTASTVVRRSPAETGIRCYSQVAWTRRTSRTSSLQHSPSSIRWFSEEVDKKTETETAAAEEAEAAAPPKKKEKKRRPIPDKYEEPDDCPSWQNPLLHNDPEQEKILESDYGPDEEIEYVPAPPLADPNDPDKVLASQEIYDLADEIVNLTMLEMKELVDKIGDYYGFEDPPFTGPGGAGGGGGDEEEDGGEEAAAEKTAFDLKLVGFDAKFKIKVIKEVRAVAGLGLKEAKEMVEGAPKVVMKDINKEMAEELKEKLEAVGAEVEIV